MVSTCLSGFQPHQFQRATSESASDIWEFVSEEDPTATVFCKVFSEASSESDGLFYEARVYQSIQDALEPDDPLKENFVDLQCVLRDLTYSELAAKVLGTYGVTEKTLVRNLMIMQCGKPHKRPALDDPKKTTRKDLPNCRNMDNSRFKAMRYAIMVTKKPKGTVVALADFVADPDIPSHQKCRTLATVVLAIHRLHGMHISHNDMHWGNILVADRTCDQKRVYEFEDRTYHIESRYQPLLFDWDRAQIEGDFENQSLSEYAGQFTPSFSTARDWLTLYRALQETYGVLEDRPPVGELFPIFFRATAPPAVHKLWRSVTARRRKWWTFASDSNLQVLQPHVSITTGDLMTFLGCGPQPVEQAAVANGDGTVSELTPETLWIRYRVKPLLVDLKHLQAVQEKFTSWAAIRLLTAQQIRSFLRIHSSVFRKLRTSRGRNGHIDRLRSIIQTITAPAGA